jgi:hypothetical protein
MTSQACFFVLALTLTLWWGSAPIARGATGTLTQIHHMHWLLANIVGTIP